MSEVTQILNAIQEGDPKASEELLPLVYDELRRLASQKIAREAPGQTLQPTALVHEAYLRLVGDNGKQQWDGRGHFFSAAAEAMRRILIDNARRKKSEKRGGDLTRQPVDEIPIATPMPTEDLLALEDALGSFAEIEPIKAELVKLRFFAGLTIQGAAQVLNISTKTADRYWAYARAWLYRQIRQTN